MLDSLAARLIRLLDDGHLPASSLGRGQRIALLPLFDAGVLEERRSGAGRRIEVRDRTALEAFARRLYPAGLRGTEDPGLPPRSRAVAERRDAKRAAGTDAEPVLLRGFGDAKLRGPEGSLWVADWSRRAGVAALRVEEGCPWSFSGELAVVENLEVFLHLEALGLSCGLALFAGGRLSRRVLSWLSSPVMAMCRFLHLGDYDPVGLDEYLRLARACPGRVRLFLPEGLEGLFAAYGKADLLRGSPALLARLRRSPDPDLLGVVELMDRHGVGLEQEILLVSSAQW